MNNSINIAKKIGPEDINTYKVNHDASNLLHETSKRLSILVQTPIRNAEKYLVTTFSKQTIPTETIDSLNPDASIPVGIAIAAIPMREVIDAIVFPTAVTGIESP